MKDFKFKLLSNGNSNHKTVKNEIDTYILYLSPYKQNKFGKNVCSGASKGCVESCLFKSGLAGIFPKINEARENKTNWLFSDQKGFYTQLYLELLVINTMAQIENKTIAVRLNGTSDLDHFALIKKHLDKDILLEFSNILFYDYTKVYKKLEKYKNYDNYIQIFSRSEENEILVLKALRNNFPVSVVFYNNIPDIWNGYPVINGDLSDLEVLKYPKQSVVIGLKAKGSKAKKDNSGFVVKTI